VVQKWVREDAGNERVFERLAYWMRSDDSRASMMAAEKLLDRGETK
jgi:hypothetical protein